MDFLKAEIAKKRKAEEASQLGSSAAAAEKDDDKGEGSSSASSPPPSKYIRRGDLQRQKQQEAEREAEARRVEKERLKRLKEEERNRRTSKSTTPDRSSKHSKSAQADDSGLQIAQEAIADARKENFNISPLEAARRLRAKGEPVKLFGETEKETRLRLRALELIEARGEKFGQNDFMRALAGAESGITLEQLEKERLEKAKVLTEGSGGNDGAGGNGNGKADGDQSTMANDKSSSSSSSSRRKGPGIGMDSLLDLDLIRKDMNKVYPIIYYTLKGLLEDWEAQLAARPLDVKMSTAGKTASAIQVQSADYLKPLFKSLRKRELPPDVLMRIAEIVHFMQKREYRNANDSYLQLSIGNAPWPIGVTMVGIHERSGREKIFASNVAHVLNDETSRKYIQSLKRLMTFAQTQYPPSDISMLMG